MTTSLAGIAERLTSSALLVACVGAVVLLPLMLIPGYFSSDEYQWAAFARPLAGAPATIDWADFKVFQYRPLTFRLWLWLSAALFDTPRLFHTVFALLGLANAMLLRLVMIRIGSTPAVAALAALLFLLHPYSVFVNGWVGTLADQLWVGMGLLIGVVLARGDHDGWRGAAVALSAMALTAVALLAKEAAVAIPAVVGLAWAFTRRRALLLAAVATAVPVAIYLALRAGVILAGPGDGHYGWSVLLPPARVLQYFSFPLAVRLPEMSTLEVTRRWALIGLLLATAAWFLAVWRTSPRLALWWLLAGVASLGPVLILSSISGQYAYGFAAISAAVWAAALARARGPARLVLIAGVAVTIAHGVAVGWHMVSYGQRAAVFSPAVAELLRTDPPRPLRLRPGEGVGPWLYLRLLHEIPHYRGVVFGDRVQLVAPDAPADYEILRDGSLRRVEGGTGGR